MSALAMPAESQMKPNVSVYLVILAFALPATAWPDCGCGPTYCTDESAFNTAIAVKKSKATADGAPAPTRLLQLYDKLDHCVAAAKTAPDSFKILFQNPDNEEITEDLWTAKNEKNDAAAVANKGKGACYVILARRAFACCDAAPAQQRLDYNSVLNLNTDDAIRCQP